ncbi:MAG: hypothetical protein DCF31_00530 [Alphaproteobacteria bacterium]|nr:MAG: hypothetical protein DCF31_00530 [Alphaproteobacteria bacterium]
MKVGRCSCVAASLLLATAAVAEQAPAANDAAALALKLSNPVAALISVPLQFNYDADIGPARDGERFTLNIQPVVPFKLSADWNLVSRTILPVISQGSIYPGAGSQTGLGDTVQSVFLTPAKAGGMIWGAGAVVLVPTATDKLLGGGKWGAGPTGVVLKQMGPWTVGGLANHLWSFAGDSGRNDISATFINPFFTHTSKSAFTYGVAADITYDWHSDTVTMPVTVSASQLTKVSGQLVTFGVGLRYYVATTEFSPHGLAGRVSATLLFPVK